MLNDTWIVNTIDYLRSPAMSRSRACARVFFLYAICIGASSSDKCG